MTVLVVSGTRITLIFIGTHQQFLFPVAACRVRAIITIKIFANIRGQQHQFLRSRSCQPIIMFLLVVILALGLACSNATTFRLPSMANGKAQREERSLIAAVLPGDPIITGGLAQGAVTAVSIYSKVILAR